MHACAFAQEGVASCLQAPLALRYEKHACVAAQITMHVLIRCTVLVALTGGRNYISIFFKCFCTPRLFW